MNIALVNMPFYLNYPSISLSTLKAIINNKPVSCTVLDLNLDFVNKIQCDDYKLMVSAMESGTLFLADWCFSEEPNALDQSISTNELCHITLPSIPFYKCRKLRESAHDLIDEILLKYNWGQYDIIGFSTAMGQVNAAFSIGGKIKALYPHVKIILGGHGVKGDAASEWMRIHSWIDVIFNGEADSSFPQFIDTMLNKQPLDNIKGITFRKNHNITYTGEPQRASLTTIPIPDYTDFFEKISSSSVEIQNQFSSIQLELSRGCYYGDQNCCTFCSDAEHKYNRRTSENAIKCLLDIAQLYDPQKIEIVDSILPQRYIQDIFEPYWARSEREIDLFIQTKPWFTRQEIFTINKIGVKEMQLGLESLSSRLLKLMKKGHSVLQAVSALKWAKQANIHIIWNILTHIEGETTKDYEEMFNVITQIWHLTPPHTIGNVFITKGSPYWYARKSSSKYKNVTPHFMYHSIYPESLDKEKIAWLFEYDGFYNIDEYAELYDIVDEWKSRYAYRPRLELTNKLTVIDTREKNREITIEEADQELLKYCDSPKSMNRVAKYFDAESISKLKNENLIISIQNMCLSLVEIPSNIIHQENTRLPILPSLVES